MTNPLPSFQTVKNVVKTGITLGLVAYFLYRYPGSTLLVLTGIAAFCALSDLGDRRKAREAQASDEWHRDLTPQMMPSNEVYKVK